MGYNGTHMMGSTLEKITGPGTITLVDSSQTGSTGSYVDVKTNTTYSTKEVVLTSGTVNVPVKNI